MPPGRRVSRYDGSRTNSPALTPTRGSLVPPTWTFALSLCPQIFYGTATTGSLGSSSVAEQPLPQEATDTSTRAVPQVRRIRAISKRKRLTLDTLSTRRSQHDSRRAGMCAVIR